MRCLTRSALLFILLSAANQSGFPQLRNNSEYSHDRIHVDQTYFVLRDTGSAEFGWASEWTYVTADSHAGKCAIFVWHFKDGTKAYSQQGEDVGDIGKNSGYLLTNKSSNLEDLHRKKIQPLTLDNYPVKIELWIGDIDDSTGFSPKILGDTACLDAPSIKFNRSYNFSNCQ